MGLVIGVKKLRPDATLPSYQTSGASGADLTALLDHDLILAPLERVLVSTGLVFEIPEGYEVQIRPRSGLSLKFGITLINTPGTVDCDYRGEIKIPIVNISNASYSIKNGDRIAQMVVCPVVQAQINEVAIVDETGRGSGGFGSTGFQ